jgi:hypothetical protein
MAITIYSSKLSGTPGEAGWCQIHEFTPQDKEKLNLRGHLIAVFATSSLEKEEGGSVSEIVMGRECLTRLHEEYFGNLEKSAFNALKDSLEKVFNEFKDSLGPLEIVASAFVDGVIYTAAVYGGQMAIYRNGMFAKIIESKGGEVIAASGYPQDGDVLVLGTSAFFKDVAYGSLKAALEKENPEAATELLAPQVHASNLAGRIGAVVLKFSEEDEGPSVDTESGTVAEQHPISSKKFSLPDLRKLGFRGTGLVAKLRTLLPAKKIYVRQQKEEAPVRANKKTTFMVGVILLLLLLVSIGFGVKQKRQKDYRLTFEADLTKASHDFEEAISLKDVDTTRSRQLFSESKQITSDLIGRGITDKDLIDLNEQIKQNQGIIMKEYNSTAGLLIDLSLLTEGFVGEKISYSDGTVYVLDPGSKKIINVVIENKKSKVFAAPSELGEVKDITSYFGRVFTLEGDGIYEIGESRKKVVDKGWGADSLIYAYGANLYVLDKENSAILRFVGLEKGFSSKQDWLSSGTTADFSNVVSWAIDGSIWMLTSDGEILRYSLGNKVTFNPKGVPYSEGAKYIYTSDDTGNLYLLFPQEKSILVLTKDGEYVAVYISDKLADAKQFIVSEEDKKIVILTQDKLYSIDLQHLQ